MGTFLNSFYGVSITPTLHHDKAITSKENYRPSLSLTKCNKNDFLRKTNFSEDIPLLHVCFAQPNLTVAIPSRLKERFPETFSVESCIKK